MAPSFSSPRLAEYRTISEAAEFLGVSKATLRNWDRTGKLKTRRHPQNGYRIYLHEDLEAILRSADLSALTDESLAPQFDWNKTASSDHFVQFYEDDSFLVESISGFIGAGLQAGEGGIVIATPRHRKSIERKLGACGIDLATAKVNGQFVTLDAATTLSQFMVDERPDPQSFHRALGSVMAKLVANGRPVRAFGEMVALLWADGNSSAAVALEELWNDLGKSHRFALFCAYPIDAFDHEAHTEDFSKICGCHVRVLPAESYSAFADPDERLREIALLQQRAISLEAEIAHRQEVESSLAKRERELADFFENATEGLHKVGPDGTILWANQAECDLLGYAPEDYIGHSIRQFHADADVVDNMLQALQCGETLENYPARLRCKSGCIKHVLINSNAYFEDGEFRYTRCFTRDVTRQHKAEEALRDADRRKDEFIATLAHELRNPLAPIRNAAEMLRLGDHDASIRSESQTILQRQVRQLTRLVDDLLDVSRITRDKLELKKSRVTLADIVACSVEMSRPIIDKWEHHLTVSLPPKPVWLDVDPQRIAQVFGNLLNNAAKYTERGGRIEIEAEQLADNIEVRVRDNGIGIPCEALAYVFDMFRQVDQSLERSCGGLGIGLTLVRRIVELHGGAVNAHSAGPGQGSTFVVRLEMAHSDSKPVADTAESSASAASVRILVVDDNRDAGNSLTKLLEVMGHEVRTAYDGLEAVRLSAEIPLDMIFMDVGMPKLNGYDATRQIRELPQGKDILIVALTGWGQPEDIERSKAAGCTAHLTKPVDMASLDRLLNEYQPVRG